MGPPDGSPGALPRLPVRAADSHKGDYGRALLIGGSRGMSGAVALAGMAALRSGAGLVTLAVPDVCLDTVASFEPSCMTIALPSDPPGRLAAEARPRIEEVAAGMTCLACGPGLGRSAALTELVIWLYAACPQPLVLDADALFALSERRGALPPAAGPRIVTPHPGEFARLIGETGLERNEAEQRAVDLAAEQGWICVLKGHRTLITDGRTRMWNSTGNPGMATGGSGDVLTGIITALVGQGLAPLAAAQLAVHVHGRAGDRAAGELGQVSLIASDLLRFLPGAFLEVEGSP